MAGGTEIAARKQFAYSLLEAPSEMDADLIRPFKTLDEGVSGYTFDLVPLHRALQTPLPVDGVPSPRLSVRRTAVELTPMPNIPTSNTTASIIPLLRASLEPLSANKLRIAYSSGSPHEMLHLIRDVGIDLFDAHWAQRAADIGVALDFIFPAPSDTGDAERDFGHNLYDVRYARDFSTLASSLGSGISSPSRCSCIACSPMPSTAIIRHSTIDVPMPARPTEPHTRAYLHHLLHTHEMSANALLASHNITILDAFFAGVRNILAYRPEDFAPEVERFAAAYNGGARIFLEARRDWAEVELARGKGRLAREKGKRAEDSLDSVVELD
jgi:hypothetical protein